MAGRKSFWGSPGGVAIVVALIGALAMLISAAISRPSKKKDDQAGPVTVTTSATTMTPQLASGDPCLRARIVAPRVTRMRADARNAASPRQAKISWEPADCVMVVQYYQRNELRGEWKQQPSGSILDIGPPLFGETELKIWREPPGVLVDENAWVWVSKE